MHFFCYTLKQWASAPRHAFRPAPAAPGAAIAPHRASSFRAVRWILPVDGAPPGGARPHAIAISYRDANPFMIRRMPAVNSRR